MIPENFAADMWEKYIQTADISNTQYRLVNAYYEVEPVSYTHLDVYKRQVLIYTIKTGSVWGHFPILI